MSIWSPISNLTPFSMQTQYGDFVPTTDVYTFPNSFPQMGVFSAVPYSNGFGQASIFNPFSNVMNSLPQQPFFSGLNFSIPQVNFTGFSNLQLPQSKFSQLSFNFTNPFAKTEKPSSTSKKSNATDSNWKPTGKRDLAYWKSQGYDEGLGKRLALDAYKRCPFVWNGQCVGYTRRTINNVFNQNYDGTGNVGYNFGHNYLERSEIKKYWKCFKINGIKPDEIPDGAVLIWPKTAFKSGKAAQFGHGAIAYKGRPYSDNVGCDTMKCNEIWIPVKA